MTTAQLEQRSKFKIKDIRAERLVVDHEYQRDIIPARVKSIANKLDLDSLGVFIVSKRDGDHFIIDGQHRHAALLYHGFGDWEVTCLVYENLSPDDEAAIYRQANDTRKITAFDDFKAGLVERDPECVAIDAIVSRQGLRVRKYGDDGTITCVTKLRQLYRAHSHGLLLEKTLQVSLEAFGKRYSAVDASLLGGLSIVLDTYGEVIELPALIHKLAKARGGAAGFIGRARTLKDIRRASMDRLVAAVIVSEYNKGRRAGKLAEL